MGKLTYKSSGVNYDLLDNLKRMGQTASRKTFGNLTDFTIDEDMLGESAFVISLKGQNVALSFVQEGLGTKNLVADAMEALFGKPYYASCAQDTVGAIVNDLITVGAKPVNITAYWAVGGEEWLKNEKRLQDLVDGWENACNLVGAAWTGGETPMLSGVIEPGTIDLAGSVLGIINPKERTVNGKKLHQGDAIILFESSGIHANGVSLARKLAEQLPEGYKTKLPSGRMYGEALLDPTIIYAKLIQDLFIENIDIHYMANITGHGWRKLMRNRKDFTYRIKEIPPVPEVLQFIQEQAEMSDEDAYATFNMGAGFAVFAPQDQAQKVIETAEKHKIKAYIAGVVEKGEKQVIIEQLKVTYSAESLQVRA